MKVFISNSSQKLQYKKFNANVVMGLAITTLSLGGFQSFAYAKEEKMQENIVSNHYMFTGSRTTQQRKAIGTGIGVYKFDSDTGNVTFLENIEGLVNPSYMILDQDESHLYAVHGDTSKVSAFKIDAATGHLTQIDTEYTGGINPVHLTIDPTNSFLILANYATGSLGVLPINSDGSLAPLSYLAELEGIPGPHKKGQTGSHPHQVQYDTTGQWIVSPDKGLDAIFVHKLTAEGQLVQAGDSPEKTRPGAGPRHIAFNPKIPYGYVSNELDNTIATYKFDSNMGKLSLLQILPTLPEGYSGKNSTSGIFTSKDGKFVYISNRGDDSIAVFKVKEKTGKLEKVAIVPTQGKQPRFFTFDPSGNWLFAANEKSHNIVKFRVDRDTGLLIETEDVIKTGSPVAIIFTENLSLQSD